MRCAALLLLALASSAQAAEIVFREGLGVRLRAGRRIAIQPDPVELLIVQGHWAPPKAGEVVGGNAWTKLTAKADGAFDGAILEGGYVYCTIESATETTKLLEAKGHSLVYVNGQPRAGDPYGYGYVSLPVALHKGTNEFLFLCGRGEFSGKLVDPPQPVSLDDRDSTTPDILKGEHGREWVALIVRNATSEALSKLTIEATGEHGGSVRTTVETVPAMSTRKVGFQVEGRGGPNFEVVLRRGRSKLDQKKLTLRVREPWQTYKRTFVSEIDGSVQYYAVNPSSNPAPGQALFLSLHGASVEAIGQADAYSPKSWGTLIAPTNRRPYGFDWEDVGRLDALEVLALAQSRFKSDPSKTYLTGHSMGGHGTWQMGAQYPDRFAAIAPSAGWISFETYAGGGSTQPGTPVENMIRQSSGPGNTLLLVHNYSQEGVYILHGDADDNVPVTEARHMRAELATFHHDFNWHEQPGAGHWWGIPGEHGASCVDWPPIFDMFARHRVPNSSDVLQIDYTTVSPGVSASCHWVTIEQQWRAFKPSRVQIRVEPADRRYTGSTDNIGLLRLDLGSLQAGSPLSIELDGQKLGLHPWPKSGALLLARKGERWALQDSLVPGEKSPSRYGAFKSVYQHRFALVYGTKGDAEENAWAQAKARFDAESFWYRGNGSVDVMSDEEYLHAHFARNVILYGNQDTNSAWDKLIGAGPVVLRKGNLKVGLRELPAVDLACLFLRPQPGCEDLSVAVIGGTGIQGMRLCDRVPIFLSGAGLPDLLAFDSSALEHGPGAARVAGFFGMDWGVESGEFAWNASQ